MRTLAVTKRTMQQMLRDKRSLALMMVAPLLILTLLHFLFQVNQVEESKIGIYSDNQALIDQLKGGKDTAVKIYADGKNPTNKIKNDDLVAFIDTKSADATKVWYENSDPSQTAKVKMLLSTSSLKVSLSNMQGIIQKQQEALTNITQQLPPAVQEQLPKQKVSGQQKSANKITNHYLYGNADSNFFDKIVPLLIGFFVFFFVFLISGMALLRERTTGTLDKVLATPIKRRELVTGYLGGYGVFAIIQTLIVVLFTVYILDIKIIGSLWLVMGVNILLAFVALTFGILLSTFANSEFQMMQFIPLAIIPQLFFSGIIPVDQMANWLQIIAHCLPMYYAGDALTAVMTKGASFSAIQFDILILALFAVLFTILNIIGLKRYRKV